MIISDVLYWVVMLTIIVSSQTLDFLTTKHYLAKGGWKEINPVLKDHVNTGGNFFYIKVSATILLIAFLLVVSMLQEPTDYNIESFSYVSTVTVILMVIVAFVNLATVLRYRIQDAIFGDGNDRQV